MPEGKHYIAIDLKSFYASVECLERGLDPLDANLVVADRSRTDKTICLAVSPSLKARGVGGRPRLFEVVQKVREINRERGSSGRSVSDRELRADRSLAVDYIVAPPRMALYIDYSSRIYGIYLRHIAPEDIHVYSIDEVFVDVTPYLAVTRMTPHEMAMMLVREVLAETGITATAGVGTNLYLAKVAMDIVAKHMEPDADGVRIAELDEMSYRRLLWGHRPLTDFWRVGAGIAGRLAALGITTMGDIARCSLDHEAALYRMLGVNAELLIDHAWGWEPVEIAQIKAYRPESKSLGQGQVLTEAYSSAQARIVAMEMAESVSLDLLDRHLAAHGVILHVGYDAENMKRPEIRDRYDGPVGTDYYGRQTPCHAHGSCRFGAATSSVGRISSAVAAIFDRTVNPLLLVRRVSVTVTGVVGENEALRKEMAPRQLELFTDYEALARAVERERKWLDKERRLHRTLLGIKKSYGRNAILKGLNFADGTTQRQRNMQIGGHKA